jgi:hypothetical protein
MAGPKTVMDIFKHLDKSNCRQCGEKTCLAFAGEVFKGRKPLHECPKLDETTIERIDPGHGRREAPRPEGEDYLAQLKAAMAGVDLSEAARRTGGRLSGGRLVLPVMGRPFGVDAGGNFYGDIHVNPWIAVPFLNYVLYGKGASPTGDWVSFRELEGGRERYPLFQKRCESAMKQVADTYTGLFDELVHLFNGKAVAPAFQSDISVVLHPLPKIPLMLCYWRPEENLGSSLNLFFDRTADKNLDIGSLFTLGVGLARMFEKLAFRHGFQAVESNRAEKA